MKRSCVVKERTDLHEATVYFAIFMGLDVSESCLVLSKMVLMVVVRLSCMMNVWRNGCIGCIPMNNHSIKCYLCWISRISQCDVS